VWAAQALGRSDRRSPSRGPRRHRWLQVAGVLSSPSAGNTVILTVTAALMGLADGRRIAVEEALLRQPLGEPDRTDQQRTWRLVPGVL